MTAIEERCQGFLALPVERLCQLLPVGRRTVYNHRHATEDPEGRMEATALRARIEELALEFPGYGYRRVTAQLTREVGLHPWVWTHISQCAW